MTFLLLRQLVLAGMLVGTAVLAAPAWSAQVVDVRIGRHPSFTRVVFEFDVLSGYRVERLKTAEGGGELIITFAAWSKPLTISARYPLIGKIDLRSSPVGSVATIGLERANLRVKEMLLAGPPRIVLDVLAPEPPRIAAATHSG